MSGDSQTGHTEPGGKGKGRPEPANLSIRADDRDYLDRRGAECGGDRSDGLRRVIREARTFRHDLRGKLGALDLIEMCLTNDAMTKDEAAKLIAELRREVRDLIEGAGEAD